MPRNIDNDILILFGPAGIEALIKKLLDQINELRGKVGLLEKSYEDIKIEILSEVSDITIPKEV